MVYNITRYDGSNLAAVADGTVDTTSTSIALIGRNSVNFGLALNENLVALMQHFANTSPPPSPVQGQIWYDSVHTSLKLWDGYKWLLVTPPFDGNAGTASIVISPTIEVVAQLSAGHIVSVTSHVQLAPAELPLTVTIADTEYDFATRFPNGLSPGITLATDPNGYRFYGTALNANALATSRSIGLGGSMSGSVAFDGSNDVVITSNLINVLNSNITADTFYTKVKVGSNGLVTDANVIIDQDVFAALGYNPPSQIYIIGDAKGNAVANGTVFTVDVTLGNTAVTPGYYNNVTVDSAGRVVAARNDMPFPVKGIILWDDILIPNGFAECNGSNVVTSAGTISLPNIPPIQPGVRYIMRIS